MALRTKTIIKEADHQDASALEFFSQQKKPEIGQFRLQVDRQTKASFLTYKDAEKAGLDIKKAHPVVRVSVYDAVECTNWNIELPEELSSTPPRPST